jgi:hypothetical protein
VNTPPNQPTQENPAEVPERSNPAPPKEIEEASDLWRTLQERKDRSKPLTIVGLTVAILVGLIVLLLGFVIVLQ